MAEYETTLVVARPPDVTFSFVSDFRNAAKWDPQTYDAEKVTEGPVGVGTQFVLTGGILPQSLLARLRIPESIAGSALPYEVVDFDAPKLITLEGETRAFRYRDHLEFSPDDASTRLRYTAKLELKGFLSLGEPLLQVVFKRIGDAATRDIPATVLAGT